MTDTTAEQLIREQAGRDSPIAAFLLRWYDNISAIAQVALEQPESTTYAMPPTMPHSRVAHFATHDPVRVLRDIEAKRRVVILCSKFVGPDPHSEWHNDHGVTPTRRERSNFEYILRELASSLADCDGFDPAWQLP